MRYAVYFCPAEDSGLHNFGHDWLNTHAIPGMTPERLHVLLAPARRYGWHATLVAPFALAEGVSYEDLHQKLADIAQQVASFRLPLQLDKLAGFLALRPSSDEATAQALSERCVRQLNALRAPLTEDAWQRRAPHLDEDELRLFREYGYPYVLQRYRFHMTLCARASDDEEQALREWLALKLTKPLHADIDALTICCERELDQPFEQIERIELGKGASA
jgi:2'-5' RNA ligase